MAEKNTNEPENHEGLLVGAARTLGGLAGKVAAVVSPAGGAQAQSQPEAATRVSATGKFRKKNKSRLPRRQKKEMKKKSAALAG